MLAEALTREAVFDALRRRRCYATNGARIGQEWWAAGAPVGSETDVPGWVSVDIAAQVRATAPLDRVEVVRDGRTVYTWRPAGAEDAAQLRGTDGDVSAGD